MHTRYFFCLQSSIPSTPDKRPICDDLKEFLDCVYIRDSTVPTREDGLLGLKTVVPPQNDTEETAPDSSNKYEIGFRDLEDILKRTLSPPSTLWFQSIESPLIVASSSSGGLVSLFPSRIQILVLAGRDWLSKVT